MPNKSHKADFVKQRKESNQVGAHTIDVDDKNFKSAVLSATRPVMADVWAEWCMPCKMMLPTVETIAKDYKGRMDVVKINVDNQPELASALSVMNIPTLIFFKSGKEVARLVGVNTKEKIEKKVKEIL